MSLTSPAASRLLVLSLTFSVALAACGGPPVATVDGGSDAASDARAPRDDGDTDRDGEGPRYALSITPGAVTLGVGERRWFRATAAQPNMTTFDVTTTGPWSVSDPAVARILPTGELEGLAPGVTEVHFSQGPVSAPPALVTVVSASTLRGLVVEPGALTFECDSVSSEQLVAYAEYLDGTRVVVNDEPGVVWSSSDPELASVDARGLVSRRTSRGRAFITVRLGSVMSASVPVTVNECWDANLGIFVDPAEATIDAPRSFTVTARSPDGRGIDVTGVATLQSSDDSIASFGAGAEANVLTPHRAGSVNVTATLGAHTATARVTVPATALRSVAIEPASATVAVGGAQALRAVGTFTDGTSRALEASAFEWSSSDPSVAVVSLEGEVRGVRVADAEAVVTARHRDSGLEATTRVQVSPTAPRSLEARFDAPLLVGGRARVEATVRLADGTERVVTGDAGLTYESSDPRVLTVTGDGYAEPHASGTASVTVRYMDASASVEAAVSGAECISGLRFSAPTEVLFGDEELDATVLGLRTHANPAALREGVVYESSDPALLTVAVGPDGTARIRAASAAATGAVTLTARYGGGGACGGLARQTTRTVFVEGTAPRELAVRCEREGASRGAPPAAVTRLVTNRSARCSASYEGADSVTRTVSSPRLAWSGEGAGLVRVTGSVTAGASPGTLVLVARVGAVTGSLRLPVYDGGAPALTVYSDPALPRAGGHEALATGVVTRFVAAATYRYTADGAAVTDVYDVGEESAWASSLTSAVDTSDAAGSKGRTTGGAAHGTSTVTARFGDLVARVDVANLDYELRSLRTAFDELDGASSATTQPGEQLGVFVRATGCPAGVPSSGAACLDWDVTPIASVQVLDTTVAALDTTGRSPLVRGVRGGITWLRSTLGPLAPSDAMLAVSADCIASIEARPASVRAVVAGATSTGHRLALFGVRSGGASVELTDPANALDALVFFAPDGDVPAGWPLRIDRRTGFTARFPASGAGSYRARFAGALCRDAAGLSNPVAVSAVAGALRSLEVSGRGALVAAGGTARFTATGVYEGPDGATARVDVSDDPGLVWSALDTAVASPDPAAPGAFFAARAGVTRVEARLGAASSAATLTVTATPLVRMYAEWEALDAGFNPMCARGQFVPREVSQYQYGLPAGGYEARVRVIGEFSDGALADVTRAVTLEALDGELVTVSPDGVVRSGPAETRGVDAPTLITARASVSGVENAVLPIVVRAGRLTGVGFARGAETLPVGLPVRRRLVARFVPVTGPSEPFGHCLVSGAAFSSSAPSVASVTLDDGAVVGNAPGSASITGSFRGFSATSAVRIVAARPAYLSFEPLVSYRVRDSGIARVVLALTDGSTVDVTETNALAGGARLVTFASMGADRVLLDGASGAFVARAPGLVRFDACFAPPSSGPVLPAVECSAPGQLLASVAAVAGAGTRNNSVVVAITAR